MANLNLKALAAALKQSNPEFKGLSDAELIRLFNKTSKDELLELEDEELKEPVENYGKHLPKLKESIAKQSFELVTKRFAQKKSLTIVRIVGFIPETSELIAYYNGEISRIDDTELVKSEAELKKVREEEKAKKAATAAKTKAAKEAKKQAESKPKK
jgi:hypothetical protein